MTDYSSKIVAAHSALATVDVNGARKTLANLSSLGVNIDSAETALDTYESLTATDANDTEALGVAWDEFKDALLNLNGEVADPIAPESGEAAPAEGGGAANITSDGGTELPVTPTDPAPAATPSQESAASPAADKPAKPAKTPQVVTNVFNIRHMAASNYPTLDPADAAHIQDGFELSLFEKFPLPQPGPITTHMNWVPRIAQGSWDKWVPGNQDPSLRPLPFILSKAGLDWYLSLAADAGLVPVSEANNERVHSIELNPEKDGWASYYAGTAKRNVTLKQVLNRVKFVPEASAPAIPDAEAIAAAAAKPVSDKPKGGGRKKVEPAPSTPPVADGPPADWKWDESTFTGIADDTFKVKLSAEGAHVFAEYEFLKAPEGATEIPDGSKLRLKAITCDAGKDEIQRRYARGEFVD